MPAEQPNILLIISDDHRWCDASSFGNPDVHMPHLDRLSSEGLRFENFYTPSPICAPARMALYSGLFPVRNGGWPNHSRCYDGTQSMVHHLRALGYRVGLHGKKHIAPEHVFPFEEVDDIAAFIARDQSTPYCMVVATNEPHAPWGDPIEALYDPSNLQLSPNLLDTPETRRALARYYSSLTRLDGKIGEYIKYVDDSRHAANTVVIYTSDHGAQFPGGKWTCYEPGLRVPFAVRWPACVAPGSSTQALAQHVDVLPTLVEIAGGEPGAVDTGRPGACDGTRGFDGESFLNVLRGESDGHRRFVYGVNTQHGTINGTPYPVRSIRDGRYKYIANPCHNAEYSNAITGEPDPRHENIYWQEWLAASEVSEEAAFLVERYIHRPHEELYDLHEDPWELRNRVNDPELEPVRERLAAQLAQWMEQQGDQGIETEMLAVSRQRR